MVAIMIRPIVCCYGLIRTLQCDTMSHCSPEDSFERGGSGSNGELFDLDRRIGGSRGRDFNDAKKEKMLGSVIDGEEFLFLFVLMLDM